MYVHAIVFDTCSIQEVPYIVVYRKRMKGQARHGSEFDGTYHQYIASLVYVWHMYICTLVLILQGQVPTTLRESNTALRLGAWSSSE